MYSNQSGSNLLKRNYMQVSEEEKRVIDSNGLAAKRIQEYEERRRLAGNDGFVSGLVAENVEYEELAVEEEGQEAVQNPIFRQREDAAQLIENAQKEAEEILAQARMQAMDILQDAKRQAEQESMQIMEQARQQGYSEGQERASKEIEKIRRECNDTCRKTEEDYQRIVDELEPQFVDTITDIYEHIFNVELSSCREILVHLISTTMQRVEGGRDFLIHVSKEDYTQVYARKQELVTAALSPNSNVEIVEDMSLAQGACFVETEGGIFDCGLDTQLTELRRKLVLLSYEKKQ